jgi:hypothetical protein
MWFGPHPEPSDVETDKQFAAKAVTAECSNIPAAIVVANALGPNKVLSLFIDPFL